MNKCTLYFPVIILLTMLSGLLNTTRLYAQSQAHPRLDSYTGQSEIKASGSITLTDGFHIPAGNTVRIYISASFQKCVELVSFPSADQNYIRTRTFKIKGINNTNVDLNGVRTTCDENQSIQYFDGLGRPIQTVQVKASPGFRDLVQPMAYDAFGREPFKYLPYASALGVSTGIFKPEAIAAQAAFYNNPVAANAPGVTPIPGAAYAETRFEPSALNRVIEQGAPGASWQPLSGHTQKLVYGTNNGTKDYTLTGFAVRRYDALPTTSSPMEHTRTLSGTSYYSPGQLFLSISKDENWTASDGKAGTTEEYKDKADGKIVLKRIFNRKPDNNLETLSTYYVYDDLGNLSFVLPPGANPDAAIIPDQNILDQYCYQYRYDARKRLIEKKIPGKGWEELVYNKLDQVVFSRDGVQRTNGKWQFSKYDAFGRTVLTGQCTHAAERASLQQLVEGQSTLWESRDDTNTSGTGTGYTNASLPQSQIDSYHTINHYDDYTFYGNNSAYNPTLTVSERVKGLSTSTRTNILGSTAMLQTVIYYDEDGRVLETIGQNHMGGTDRVVNTWNFAGELMVSMRTHTSSPGGVATTVATRYEYDHVGRKLATMASINGQAEVVLSKLTYNETGQLLKKELHGTGGANFLQNMEYAYNARGWLNNSRSDQFSMRLRYEDGTLPQYNGNIANQDWGSGTNYPNVYTYGYDKLNRLSNGASTGVAMSESITYDVMGNISTLSRDGGAANQYHYTGNQLNTVDNVTAVAYSYDANGNALTDGRTGMSLTYNHLNLPATAVKSGVSVSYVYDALGRKLSKTSVINGNSVTRNYIDGIEYNGNVIDVIHTGEGLAQNNGGVYSYQYNLTDHLGNVRYTFNRNPVTGFLERLQSDDYYAFGKRKSSGSPVSENNKYLYNGKELQDELGSLNEGGQYDYGARFYDPVIARWNVIDPMTEKYYGISPYAYSMNNPSSLMDPDGRDVDISNLTDEDQKKALVEFLKTRNGQAFISSYLKKGQSLTITIGKKNHVYTTKKDGEFANDLLALGSSDNLGASSGTEVVGRTLTAKPDGNELGEDGYGGSDNKYDVRKKVVEQIWLKTGQGVDDAISTLGHEAFVHAFPDQSRLRELRQELNNGTIQPGTKAYEKRLELITRTGTTDHKNLSNGQAKAYLNFSQQMDAANSTTRFTKSYNEDVKNHK